MLVTIVVLLPYVHGPDTTFPLECLPAFFLVSLTSHALLLRTLLFEVHSHFPWFSVYNTLNVALPVPEDLPSKLGRNAVIGFSASVVSDCCSNSLRVVKTYRQTHADVVSYPSAVRQVIAQDGVSGLFGRGLQTRILANGFQGLLFTVLWKLLEEQFSNRLDRK